MSALPASEPELMTEADYLAFEDASEAKHEFVDGHVYDWPGYEYDAQGLAGASRAHNRLQTRLVRLLGPAADAANCEVFGSDMRLRVRLSLLRARRLPPRESLPRRHHRRWQGADR